MVTINRIKPDFNNCGYNVYKLHIWKSNNDPADYELWWTPYLATSDKDLAVREFNKCYLTANEPAVLFRDGYIESSIRCLFPDDTRLTSQYPQDVIMKIREFAADDLLHLP